VTGLDIRLAPLFSSYVLHACPSPSLRKAPVDAIKTLHGETRIDTNNLSSCFLSVACLSSAIRLVQDVLQAVLEVTVDWVPSSSLAVLFLATALPWGLYAQQGKTKPAFECNPDTLTPYGPLAECKFQPLIDLHGYPFTSAHVSWVDAFCFALELSGYEGLSKEMANSLVSSGQEWQGDELSQKVTHSWQDPDGKNFRVRAIFAPRADFSSWVSHSQLPALLSMSGEPAVLVSAKVRCNRLTDQCEFVEGTIYPKGAQAPQTISFEDWQRVDSFIKVVVTEKNPTDVDPRYDESAGIEWPYTQAATISVDHSVEMQF